MVDVAQLVRAPVCGTGGRGFKSRHPPHIKCLELFGIFPLISKHFLFPSAESPNSARYFVLRKVFLYATVSAKIPNSARYFGRILVSFKWLAKWRKSAFSPCRYLIGVVLFFFFDKFCL